MDDKMILVWKSIIGVFVMGLCIVAIASRLQVLELRKELAAVKKVKEIRVIQKETMPVKLGVGVNIFGEENAYRVECREPATAEITIYGIHFETNEKVKK